ncbi:hypothetical protein [Defluviimonas salinarum]|uniref:Uncharacterized protein n=1 Tax=Defluviimonas salinarum TaxID=2992147 RepID=A0ABT3J496_9RHOB|nr:hypothetical protein [Defluviimonas salinarum]MCW3782491.1 hypothetical protein [Defluviimonas salinarum]
MTIATRWNGVMSRITCHEAVNIDHLLAPLDPRARKGGKERFPEGAGRNPFLAHFRDPSTVCVGVRISEPRNDLAALAMQLTTLAMERGVEVVVLSHLDYSGLERFGFRAERICGETKDLRDACERQIVAFWNLEVII